MAETKAGLGTAVESGNSGLQGNINKSQSKQYLLVYLAQGAVSSGPIMPRAWLARLHRSVLRTRVEAERERRQRRAEAGGRGGQPAALATPRPATPGNTVSAHCAWRAPDKRMTREKSGAERGEPSSQDTCAVEIVGDLKLKK